jgi:glycosyltransferase involved in cell wall biosynthesis
MTRVGLVLIINDNWLGGVNYYRNLVTAVYNMPNRNIEFVIFTDRKSSCKYLEDFQHLEIIRTSLFDRFSLAWLFRKVGIRLFRNDFLFSRLLKKNKVDILSHSGWLGKKSKIPAIGWIPDFQHLHLQNFFTEKEREFRNKSFADLCNLCTKVIVSSHDALKDLYQFAPGAIDKAVILRFSVPPMKIADNSSDLDELKLKYSFTSPFFLLPNQFWAHKNHKVVVEALGILKKKNKKITVLATGNTHDPRQLNFFSSLEKLIESNDVKGEFKVLGLIPKNHLEVLFINANAIINPSLFEGWSTTVEEAKVLGKRILLSNLSIHQEQKPTLGVYFEPHDANKLALLLEEYVNVICLNEPDINEAEKNFINYGVTYQNIVNHVVHQA